MGRVSGHGSTSVSSSHIASRVTSGSRGPVPARPSPDRADLSMQSLSMLRSYGSFGGDMRRNSELTENTMELHDATFTDLRDEIRQVKRIYPRVKFKDADVSARA